MDGLWSGFFTPRLRSSRANAPSTSKARAARTKICGAGFSRCWFAMMRLHPADTEQWQAAAGPSIGPYQVLSKLGAGGMGDVYLVLDSRLGRRVALKVLLPQFAADPERKRRFQREARAASALNHPNIVASPRFQFRRQARLSGDGVCSRQAAGPPDPS